MTKNSNQGGPALIWLPATEHALINLWVISRTTLCVDQPCSDLRLERWREVSALWHTNKSSTMSNNLLLAKKKKALTGRFKVGINYYHGCTTMCSAPFASNFTTALTNLIDHVLEQECSCSVLIVLDSNPPILVLCMQVFFFVVVRNFTSQGKGSSFPLA